LGDLMVAMSAAQMALWRVERMVETSDERMVDL
jgi:hypothetical protein